MMITKKEKERFYAFLNQCNQNTALDNPNIVLKASRIKIPVGLMIVIGSETALYALDFMHKSDLQQNIEKLLRTFNATIVPGVTPVVLSMQEELFFYFAGTLTKFKKPLQLSGTPFQQAVWQQLMNIPYGQTISYAQLATMVGQPKACRTVANANGANQLAIIIPCHRVINSNGKLGGYTGGISRKLWLIAHEQAHYT